MDQLMFVLFAAGWMLLLLLLFGRIQRSYRRWRSLRNSDRVEWNRALERFRAQT